MIFTIVVAFIKPHLVDNLLDQVMTKDLVEALLALP